MARKIEIDQNEFTQMTEDMCHKYCIHQKLCMDQEEMDSYCDDCPMNKLYYKVVRK